MVRRLFSSNYLWLFLFLVAGGCASLVLRYELLWDFANYHYYNPWAFFNDRWMYDIAPAGINTFFNPLLDIPLYLLIQHFNNYPNFIIFIQGLWSGVAAFMAFQLAKIFFDFNTWKGRVQTFLAVAIGITSWPFFMQIGTSTNEMPIALMVMFSWWLLFKEITSEKSISAKSFFISGLVLGAAAGLKLTAATYCVSTGIALILCYKMFKPFPKLIGFFILGGIIGFLITNGFWMWRLWQTFENPVFPLLNNIFKSEWFDERSYRDEMFLPKDILGYIFYPFYIMSDKLKKEGQSIIMDFRFIVMFFIVIGTIIYIAYRFIRYRQLVKTTPVTCFLSVLWLSSYVIWLVGFSIQRYSIPIFISGSIIIVLIAFFLYPKEGNVKFVFYSSTLVILLYSFVMTPHYSDEWGKWLRKPPHLISFFTNVWPDLKDDLPFIEKYGEFSKFVDIEEINLPDNTLLQLYEVPVASAIPVFANNTNIRAVSIHIDDKAHEGDIFSRNTWMELKKNTIKSHQGNKVILISLYEPVHITNVFYQYAKHQGMECHLVINNMFDWVLCVPPEQVKEIFKWRYQDQSSK